MKFARLEEQRGATMVEFVVVFPVFVLLLLISLDLLRISYNYITVQYVADRVLRQVIVGRQGYPYDKSPYTETHTAIPYTNQASWLIHDMVSLANSFHVPLAGSDITVCSIVQLRTHSCNANDFSGIEQASSLFSVKVNIPARTGYAWGESNLLSTYLYPVAPAQMIAKNEAW